MHQTCGRESSGCFNVVMNFALVVDAKFNTGDVSNYQLLLGSTSAVQTHSGGNTV